MKVLEMNTASEALKWLLIVLTRAACWRHQADRGPVLAIDALECPGATTNEQRSNQEAKDNECDGTPQASSFDQNNAALMRYVMGEMNMDDGD